MTGGGLVPGSALLIGGEPGIGKSTLLLQVAAAVASAGGGKAGGALYVSGEEAAAQVRLRAERLGVTKAPVMLAAETNLSNILATLQKGKRPGLVVVDSIQTVWSDALESAPGTVAQVRAATQLLIRYAKQAGAVLLLVGHVTKDGQIAGPKVVEHMVDTVLYFEGDRGSPFRILRAVKNRFGATDEIGVFEMVAAGLREGAEPVGTVPRRPREREPGRSGVRRHRGDAADPRRDAGAGRRVDARHAAPRRRRLGCQPAVHAACRAGSPLRRQARRATTSTSTSPAACKIAEPAADLAAAAALMSSLSGVPLPMDRVFFGEISLSGAVRPAAQATARLKEAQKLGFKSAVVPASGEIDGKSVKLELERLAHLKGLAETLA